MKLTLLLNKLIFKQDLTPKEASFLFEAITSGELTDIQVSAFLVALAAKKESITEITAAIKVLRKKCITISFNKDLLDTCGTGGDGQNVTTKGHMSQY